MTLAEYCEQMGLRIVRDLTPNGRFRCRIKGFQIEDSCGKVEAAADGVTFEEATAALARFIAGRILRNKKRPTTLYWVPDALAP